jgi:hypothetical protein
MGYCDVKGIATWKWKQEMEAKLAAASLLAAL